MTRLGKILTQGVGPELDAFGKLVDLPRKSYWEGRVEPDQDYRARLSAEPVIKLITTWLEPAE